VPDLRLSRAGSGQEIFGADEAAQWRGGALEALIKSGLLERAEPAQVIECDGCERNCFMPVHVRPGPGIKRGTKQPFLLFHSRNREEPSWQTTIRDPAKWP
jgi:hypothetical protein